MDNTKGSDKYDYNEIKKHHYIANDTIGKV